MQDAGKKYLVRIARWSYKYFLTLIADLLIHSDEHLTPEHLEANGWTSGFVNESSDDKRIFWYQPNIKERDRVSIEFADTLAYYRVFHGENRTFIALESSIEWLELYLLLMDKHSQFNEPIDILNHDL